MAEKARPCGERRAYKKPAVRKHRKLADVTEGGAITVTGGTQPD